MDIQDQVAEARRSYTDLAGLAEASDEDRVFLTRRNSLSDAWLAEIGRRQLKASTELKQALETTSRRLYVLTAVLTLYTAETP